MNPIVKAAHLSKTYANGSNKTHAVRDISMEAYPGESIAVTGPSGCGKTTLLNVLGLVLEPTGGILTVDSYDPKSLSAKLRAHIRNKTFGYIVQDFALVEEYTVYENIEIPLVYASNAMGLRQRRERILAVLERFGIEDKIREKSKDLSGGQRQRVAIARAIVNDPKIILADEPTGSLDSSNSKESFAFLLALVRDGKTLIMATHNRELASQCDREIRILDGVKQ